MNQSELKYAMYFADLGLNTVETFFFRNNVGLSRHLYQLPYNYENNQQDALYRLIYYS
jgi:hypothetical protein